jgi:hypothetical protein
MKQSFVLKHKSGTPLTISVEGDNATLVEAVLKQIKRRYEFPDDDGGLGAFKGLADILKSLGGK